MNMHVRNPVSARAALAQRSRPMVVNWADVRRAFRLWLAGRFLAGVAALTADEHDDVRHALDRLAVEMAKDRA